MMRLVLEDKKKKDYIAKLKLLELLKIESMLKSKPSILENSKEIAGNLGNKPIYERFEDIIQKKQLSLKEKREIKDKNRETYSFKPKIQV